MIDTFFTSISTVAATFLGLAALPWILNLFEKITLPGGVELDLKNIERTLNEQAIETNEEDTEPFRFLELDDSNLAMAVLRIEIEKRIRKISENRGLNIANRRLGLRQLLKELERERVVDKSVVMLILDMLPAMNDAAHGIELPSGTNNWV